MLRHTGGGAARCRPLAGPQRTGVWPRPAVRPACYFAAGTCRRRLHRAAGRSWSNSSDVDQRTEQDDQAGVLHVEQEDDHAGRPVPRSSPMFPIEPTYQREGQRERHPSDRRERAFREWRALRPAALRVRSGRAGRRRARSPRAARATWRPPRRPLRSRRARRRRTGGSRSSPPTTVIVSATTIVTIAPSARATETSSLRTNPRVSSAAWTTLSASITRRIAPLAP